MSRSHVIVVVGGGASGTLAAVHLLHCARARGVPLHVVLIDRDGRHGLGQAYSTPDPHHLLNTRAERMSALEHDPHHFVKWTRSQGLNPAGAAAGRLRVLRGHVDGATPDSAGLTLSVSTAGSSHDLRVAWLVNATGPAFTVPGEGLLSRLLADGLARPGPLGLGLDADGRGRVLDAAGRPDERIVTLGPTLRGKLYETTAIPEIRAQAATLAAYLIERIERH
ncbi:hypothetical protein Aple_033500 [Acrocarpospora pleiomorpha]|uniref:FAD-dependent urate hydroxylase HpyO/Asp monooxygenase CreE-like FAD/NAD(P)-binding domain-containing protein n=1 Tax=Acrocarpospora pleiomorpha TaxID=90975 RepID=A0A5M3XGQ1_9ACTN|nr:FAD/NAD(P)-binding protein [Acrocarpospora pleiomorpha]GES20454.1 hypothetical protein Aple_033500 [Acrocarpospora pleiomorpha]